MLILRSLERNKFWPLQPGKTRIGRLSSCDITLRSDSVSKEHAEFEFRGDQLMLTDLDSRNNTRLNGEEIRGLGPRRVMAGDRVMICNFHFEILDQGDAESALSDSAIQFVDNKVDDETWSPSSSILMPRHDIPDYGGDPRLLALLTISQSLKDVLATDDVLQRAVNILLEIFPEVDRVVIGFTTPDNEFEPRWWRQRHAQSVDSIRVSRTVVQHVVQKSAAILTRDTSDLDDAKSVVALALRSIMCAPLHGPDGSVMGMIQADSKAAGSFGKLDLEVLSSVATQISLAINYSEVHAKAVADALVRQDVEAARRVQAGYLPQHPPQVAGYAFNNYYQAARHVGGDYYDYIPLPDGRLAIAIGDVVGKGVPAAMTMVQLAVETHAGLELHREPCQVLTRLNQRLSDTFLTVALLILDPRQHTVTIANAGHEQPFLRRANGELEPVGEETTDPPISVVAGLEYRQITFTMEPGDHLLLYSDGVTDAENSQSGERFRAERLKELLQREGVKVDEFVPALVNAVEGFAQDAPQFDDMCIVGVQRTQ